MTTTDLWKNVKRTLAAIGASASLAACATTGNANEANNEGHLSVACTRGGAEVLYVDPVRDIKIEGHLNMYPGAYIDGYYHGGIGAAYVEGHSRNGFGMQLDRLESRYSGDINIGATRRTLNGIDIDAQNEFLRQYNNYNSPCRMAVDPWQANGYIPRPAVPQY